MSANFQCYLADMSPWLDPNSTPRRHGTVLRASVLDISGVGSSCAPVDPRSYSSYDLPSQSLDEVPLFNLTPFELEGIVAWIQEKMAFLNVELITKLQVCDHKPRA